MTSQPGYPGALIEVSLVLDDGTSASIRKVNETSGVVSNYTGLPVYNLTPFGIAEGDLRPRAFGGSVAKRDPVTGVWSFDRASWAKFVTQEAITTTPSFLALENVAQITDDGIDGLLEDRRQDYTTELGFTDGQRYRGSRQPQRELELPIHLGGDGTIERIIAAWSSANGFESAIPQQQRAAASAEFIRKMRPGARGLLVVRRFEPFWSIEHGRWLYNSLSEKVSALAVRVAELRVASTVAPGIRNWDVPANVTLVADEDPFWTDLPVVRIVPSGTTGYTTVTSSAFAGFSGSTSERTWRRFVFQPPSTPGDPNNPGVIVYADQSDVVPAYVLTIAQSAFTATTDRVVFDTHPARRGAWRVSAAGVRTNVTSLASIYGTLRSVSDPMRVARSAGSVYTTHMIHSPNARATPIL